MSFLFPTNIESRLYEHRGSNATVFYFPITGMIITQPLKIGKCDYIPLSLFKEQIKLPQNMVENISVIAKTTVDVPENWIKNAIDNYSIALQLTKQSIGAIYLSIYNSKKRCDNNRRIVISPIGKHEVDEGLVIYQTNLSTRNTTDVSSTLFFSDKDASDLFLANLDTINNQILMYYSNNNEYGNKILKSLEIIYCINNEIYSNERILKICAALSMLFKADNDTKDVDSPWIASRLNQLFHYRSVNIIEKIPETVNCLKKTKKNYNEIFIDIYSRIRNSFMHGIIDPYQEFTVITTDEYLLYIVSLYELIDILILDGSFNSLQTTKELVERIKQIELSHKSKTL
ncbi:MAG: hypothetical protein IK990_06525 [Ruminiclostridium sp.]|nr:hypothetical protein [Ruminiclostridium sp.]MBP3855249.1 hypothetical protein [Ruminiclostridium sp.]